MKVSYGRFEQRATPANKVLRREIVRLRDVEKLSWRRIAATINGQTVYKTGGRITFQRVCQLYNKVKKQSGSVDKVKEKEVMKELKLKRGKQIRTQDLTPDAIDSIINLNKADDTILEVRQRKR